MPNTYLLQAECTNAKFTDAKIWLHMILLTLRLRESETHFNNCVLKTNKV